MNYSKKTTITEPTTEKKKVHFKVLGVDSGVGVEVYKYSFLKHEKLIKFLSNVAKANPDCDINIEFSSFFNHDDIEKWENADKDPVAVKKAAMDLVRSAYNQHPDLIVGACNTLNLTLITREKEERTGYQQLIEEGFLKFNPSYGEDVTQPIKYGHRVGVNQPILSVGILDSTSGRLYKKSVFGSENNIIEDPKILDEKNKRKPKKAAIIVFSTQKTAEDGIYKKNIDQIHAKRGDKDIALDVIPQGVKWAQWLNSNPNPEEQPELMAEITKDVRAVVKKLVADFTVNELLEMSPVQIGFCCTHFPLVEEEVMAAFDKEMMRAIETMNNEGYYVHKNDMDAALVKKIINGERRITFEAVVQGPDLFAAFKKAFEEKYAGVLNFDFLEDGKDKIYEGKAPERQNLTLLSSIHGKMGSSIPQASFELIKERNFLEVMNRYHQVGDMKIDFDVRYADKTLDKTTRENARTYSP